MRDDSRQPPEELFKAYGRVEELNIDAGFAMHMAGPGRQYPKHIVTGKEVRQVYSAAPEYFENTGEDRKAPIIMVGPTDAGRMVCVPIAPTHIEGLWYPVTAFEATAHHILRYGKRLKP